MALNNISFPNDNFNYLTLSWDDLADLTFNIAQQIKKDQLHFDRIITLSKGGWPMTRSMVDFLQIDQVASIGVRFYKEIGERLEKPEIYQDLPVSIQGEEILICDDVADTGKSLQFVKEYLISKGVAKITTATLFYKLRSVIKPDYFAQITSDWIIFPYEAVDGINVLGNKWRKQNIPGSEIVERLKQLSFKTEWINYYQDNVAK